MLATLNIPTLEKRRDAFKLAMFFKVLNNDIAVNNGSLHRAGVYTRGQRGKLMVPFSRVNCHLNSFFPTVIRLWNSLPDDIAPSGSIDIFRRRVAKWLSLPAPVVPLQGP